MLQFLPLIAQGVGLISGLFGGMQASRENERQAALQAEQMKMMQDILNQIQSNSGVGAYQAVARQGFDEALGGYAARGLGSSGVAGRGLGQAMANAAMQAQNARVSALSQVFQGRQSMANMYGQNINPDPYAGVGAALGGLGNAAGTLLGQQAATPTSVPAPSNLNQPLPTSGYSSGNIPGLSDYMNPFKAGK